MEELVNHQSEKECDMYSIDVSMDEADCAAVADLMGDLVAKAVGLGTMLDDLDFETEDLQKRCQLLTNNVFHVFMLICRDDRLAERVEGSVRRVLPHSPLARVPEEKR